MGPRRHRSLNRGQHHRMVAICALFFLAVASLVTVPVAASASASASSAPRTESGVKGPDSVTAFGTAATAVPGTTLSGLNAPVVGISGTPDGGGYWLAAADGGVFNYGDAPFIGSLGNIHLNEPIVGMSPSATGHGYWLVASDGGVFAFGDAPFEGSLGDLKLNAPIVGIATTPSGNGYWLVASDGGVFSFGDATFRGSLGAVHLNAPIVGIAATSDGFGYRLVASDGGVFAFGDALFEGSLGDLRLNAPITAMAATGDGNGYWLLGADGGVFSFGDAPFEGSDGSSATTAPAIGIVGRPGGYWIAYGTSPGAAMLQQITAFVDGRSDNVTVAVEDRLTGQIFQFRPGVVEHTASTLKVDILATLLTKAQAEGRGLTAAEQSLAVPMIEDSLDSAADSLWTTLGPASVGSFERSIGMTSTVPAADGVWGTTTTTALDRLAMVRALVSPSPILTPSSQAYVLNLMEHITPSQDWGATGGVPAGVSVALKNGFAVVNGWQINTEAWVNGLGRDYLIAVLTDGNASEQYGIDTVNGVSSIVWRSLAP